MARASASAAKFIGITYGMLSSAANPCVPRNPYLISGDSSMAHASDSLMARFWALSGRYLMASAFSLI